MSAAAPPAESSSPAAKLSRLKAIKNSTYMASPRAAELPSAAEATVAAECTVAGEFSRQTSFGVRGGGRAEVDRISVSLGFTRAEDLYLSDEYYSSAFGSHLSPPSSEISAAAVQIGKRDEHEEEEGGEGSVGSFVSDIEMEESGLTVEQEIVDGGEDEVDLLPESEVISPSLNSTFMKPIKSWIKGELKGRGSYGAVYEAISDDGFFFAVKEVCIDCEGISIQSIEQLEQEINILSRLEHENILRYMGMDKEDGKLYIFLELGTQGSLVDLYRKYHLQDSQVSAYTKQILKGLNYLHSMDVIHRDIKCANILVFANGLVKLADFGLAKEISKLSRTRSFKGTIYWMSPEVAKAMPYGPSADIWSLGCTVLEMLTRRPPYHDKDWPQALFTIGHGIPPHIPDTLSTESRAFIQMCLRENPDERPSAAELLNHPYVNKAQ